MKPGDSHFKDPAAVATYATDAARKVPGLTDLHRMTTWLLAERAPGAARVLVVGAGGGLEIRSMAAAKPGWRFTGVDPSQPMLDLARQANSSIADRIDLVAGTIDQAPAGPFDAATCLLVLHFLDRDERVRTLREIHRRLRPGARLVVAHHAPPTADRVRWMARSAAFGSPLDLGETEASSTGQSLARRLPLLDPAEEEATLVEAGFSDVEMFYAALSFRGWVATRP